MLRYVVILFGLCPLWSFGQQVVSAETIWNKCVDLHKQGKLDSIKTNITIHKDYFHRIDSIKQFYVYSDTLKLDDGYYGIGLFIIDPFMEYHHRQIGQWTYYYPSGKVYAQGSYAIGAYTECQFAGPTIIGYSFKTGAWAYWYENQQLMAKGVYRLAKKPEQTNCGADWITVTKIDKDWKFYLTNGSIADENEAIKSTINSR